MAESENNWTGLNNWIEQLIEMFTKTEVSIKSNKHIKYLYIFRGIKYQTSVDLKIQFIVPKAQISNKKITVKGPK